MEFVLRPERDNAPSSYEWRRWSSMVDPLRRPGRGAVAQPRGFTTYWLRSHFSFFA